VTVDHVVVLVPGWHDWHAFAGFVAPLAYVAPPITHCVPHAPLEQTCPLPHAVPSDALVHADVLVAGSHAWHVFVGFAEPLA